MKLYPLAYDIETEDGIDTHIEYHTSEVKCKKARATLNREIALKLKSVPQIITVYPIEIPLKKEGVLRMAEFTSCAVRGGLVWVTQQMMAADAAGEDTL